MNLAYVVLVGVKVARTCSLQIVLLCSRCAKFAANPPFNHSEIRQGIKHAANRIQFDLGNWEPFACIAYMVD